MLQGEMFLWIVTRQLCHSRGLERKLVCSVTSRRGLRGSAIQVGDGPSIGRHTPAQSSDVLSDALINSDPSQLLEVVGLNKRSLSGIHVLAALARLSKLTNTTEGRTKSLTAAVSVETDLTNGALLGALCDRLLRTSRQLNADQLVNALKHLLALDVSPQSVIFQTVLQHLRMDLNDLRLKQLVFLDFLLRKVQQKATEPSVPLVEALKQAVPMVVRNHLRIEIDGDDIKELLQLLEFCAKHRFYWKDLQRVTTALERHCPLSLEASMAVLWSASFLRQCFDNASDAPMAVVNPVLRSAVSVVCRKVFLVDADDLLALTSRLAQRGLYIEPLFAACSKRVYRTPSECNLTSVSRLMSAFALVRHVDTAMLDEYCFCLSKVDDLFLEALPADQVVPPFAVANYRSPLLQSVLERWCDSQSPLQWDAHVARNFRLLVELETVGFRSSAFDLPSHIEDASTLLKFVLNNVEEAEDVCSVLCDGLLLLQLKLSRCGLNQIRSIKEDQGFMAVAEYIFGTPQKASRVEISPLGKAFKLALGGNYVVCDALLSARTGINFDHLIVSHSRWNNAGFTSNDQLEPGSLVPSLLDNSHGNEKSATTVVLVRNLTDYCANAPRLLGRPSLEAEVLRLVGHRVIQISLDVWNGMPEYERLPYLRRIFEEVTTKYD